MSRSFEKCWRLWKAAWLHNVDNIIIYSKRTCYYLFSSVRLAVQHDDHHHLFLLLFPHLPRQPAVHGVGCGGAGAGLAPRVPERTPCRRWQVQWLLYHPLDDHHDYQQGWGSALIFCVPVSGTSWVFFYCGSRYCCYFIADPNPACRIF